MFLWPVLLVLLDPKINAPPDALESAFAFPKIIDCPFVVPVALLVFPQITLRPPTEPPTVFDAPMNTDPAPEMVFDDPIFTCALDVAIELTPVMALLPMAIAPDMVPPANGRYVAAAVAEDNSDDNNVPES
jgi:hypothetical protein